MSNQNNFFSLGRKLFDNESITMDDFRNHITKRKEKQILEHRKKIMKDIYTKMFSSSFNQTDYNNLNVQNQNKNNNMEIDDEINNTNNINGNENKKKLIEKCLSEAKNLYNNLGEEFLYQIIEDNKISFCPKCAYPVIIVDKANSEEKNNNDDSIIISCVNSCFQFSLNETVFKKYSMDNLMDLYSQSLKNDNQCNHNDIAPITSGDDSILFTCITCLFDQFK